MLKTLDGITISDIVKVLGYIHTDDLSKPFMEFDVSGKTSKYLGELSPKEEKRYIVHVEISELYVEMSGGGNKIRIPNYDHEQLAIHIENGIELLFFEFDL